MAKPTKQNDEETVKVEIGDPRRYFCDRAFVLFNEEHFILALQTGSVVDGQYVFTPKHAKKLMLRLQEKIEEYEKKYGELKVSLPKKK